MNTFSLLGLRLRVLLSALMLLAGGAAASHAMAQPGPGHHGGAGEFGFLGGPHINKLLDSVNATDQQRTQIHQIMQTAHQDLAAQRRAGAGLHEQALKLFTQPTVDANAVEALRQQMLQQHDQASRRMMQAMLDISRVLTPEQRVRLGQRMQQREDMMRRHMQERRALENPQQH